MDCVLREILCLSSAIQVAEVGEIKIFLKVIDKVEVRNFSVAVAWTLDRHAGCICLFQTAVMHFLLGLLQIYPPLYASGIKNKRSLLLLHPNILQGFIITTLSFLARDEKRQHLKMSSVLFQMLHSGS